MSTDYDDILYRIEEKACAAGMLPSQFWEEEPADTLIYIEQRSKQKQIEAYNVSLLTATMQGINLSNAFREKGARAIEYPSIYDVYEWDDPNRIDAFTRRKLQLKARLAKRGK